MTQKYTSITISVLVMMVAYISYVTAIDYVHDRGQKYYSDKNITLPDIGFDNVSDKRDNNLLYDIKETINVLYLITFLMLACKSSTAISEFLLTSGVILFIKNILFSSTILPDPSKKCKKYNPSKFCSGSCYDLVISSHATLLFVSLFVLLKNNLVSEYLLFFVFVPMITSVLYIIISLRQHYTIDIINAAILSYFVHYYVSNELINAD